MLGWHVYVATHSFHHPKRHSTLIMPSQVFPSSPEPCRSQHLVSFFFPGLTYCMIAGPEGSRIIRSFDHQYMKHSGSVEGHSRGTRASTNRTGMRQPVHIGGCWPGEAERPLLPTCRGGERLSVTHATCSGPSSLRLPSIRQAWRRTVSVSRFSCIWEAPACVH